MTYRRLPPPSPLALQRIERLSRGVSDPVSYLQGRAAGNQALPANILCFVRRAASVLTMTRRVRLRHQHHRFVLIVAVRGSGRVCVDVDTFPLRPGQTQLVFPFQFHSFLGVEPERICWLFITFEMEREEELESLRSSASRDIRAANWPLVAEFVRGWVTRAPVRLLQLQLATLLVRLGLRRNTAALRRKGEDRLPEAGILSLVNRHVLPRLNRPILVKVMAAALGQSESHLRRRFRLATGVSLGRHLRELRLRRACSLLYGTSLSVGEVATRCGFESIYAFSRAFRNELDLSPRAYRKTVMN